MTRARVLVDRCKAVTKFKVLLIAENCCMIGLTVCQWLMRNSGRLENYFVGALCYSNTTLE